MHIAKYRLLGKITKCKFTGRLLTTMSSCGNGVHIIQSDSQSIIIKNEFVRILIFGIFKFII